MVNKLYIYDNSRKANIALSYCKHCHIIDNIKFKTNNRDYLESCSTRYIFIEKKNIENYLFGYRYVSYNVIGTMLTEEQLLRLRIRTLV